MPTESEWAGNPWLIPAVLMYGRLAYKFEGMTDMINGAFMEDLSELLNAATGDQRGVARLSTRLTLSLRK